MDISANQALNIGKVCLGLAIYDVQLPDIYLTNFLCTYNNRISCFKAEQYEKYRFFKILYAFKCNRSGLFYI